MLDIKEGVIPTHYSWQGIDFQVATPRNSYLLLIVGNGDRSDSYTEEGKKIDGLNQRAVDLIQGLYLPQYKRKTPFFSCVIVPASNFLSVTGIPDNFNWATICSRGVWQDTREDAVIVSSLYDTKDVKNTPINQLTESQADIMREAVHEHLPTLRDTYLPYPSASVLPISEAMDESVPRLVMGLQSRMPNSTTYLLNLPENEILTVEQLWNGFSVHSANPVSTNPAYGSAFLLGAGIMGRLQREINAREPVQALAEWLEIMIKAKDGHDVVQKLADRIHIDQTELLRGRLLQREGQELLTQLNSDIKQL